MYIKNLKLTLGCEIKKDSLEQIRFLNSTVVNVGKRPTMSVHEVGYQLFDKSLGKPIWWNGVNWVDSVGVIV